MFQLSQDRHYKICNKNSQNYISNKPICAIKKERVHVPIYLSKIGKIYRKPTRSFAIVYSLFSKHFAKEYSNKEFMDECGAI